jgi:hypothetical protein
MWRPIWISCITGVAASLLAGCSSVAIEPPTVHAEIINSSSTTLTNPDGKIITVDWIVNRDGNKFVAVGSAFELCNPGCQGVPPHSGWFLPRIPLGSPYCVNTLKLGAKQPTDTVQSYLVLQLESGYGRPAVSVRSDDGVTTFPNLCFPTSRGDAILWIGNNWDQQQVMTFMVAGELR